MMASSVPGPASSGSFAPTAGRIAGAVLAGGRSSRMGATKAFAPLAGRPLLAHVLDRLRPQTARVYLNARDDSDRWRAFGCPLVEDAPEWRGPRQVLELLTEYFAARAAEHRIAGEPALVARIFMGMMFQLVVARKLWGDDPMDQGTIDAIVGVFLNGVLR